MIRMKRRTETLITMAVVIAIGCAIVLLLRDAQDVQPELVLVTRVIDGDTIIIEGGQKVRLLGIDSHERGEACYDEARIWLKSLIEMRNVSLERDGENKDKHGRLLRWVWYNGSNVNVALVRAGLAIVRLESSLKYEDELRQAEQAARQEGIGCLWKEPR